ncbi:recombinase family protein [Mesorhizobium kowhaii]|uniref:Recombinase family protein n=1 Tax=Mesorhizobium kowhaii TaxID=1300272 RepID=A0A2W7CV31_9HYPH|nr:recombinase family protein [Mesorhizobium kowhaii]PZV40533.1 recombinase family protein [Mesorhizobium kowhaii]
MGKASATQNSGRREVRAAQYLRMSTEYQTYSIENQRDAIRDYADVMGYDIVATYEDPGRSGLSIGGRPGLRRLLRDVESGQADFETVVVYDVSRWGRFQNIDESASYEYRCQMAGVRIEFCAEQFANDGSIGSDVLKAIKRTMAAELSRMLSQKTFIGQSRIIKMGFRGGGYAGYGFRRLMVDASGNPKTILKQREYKSLVTDRVILVPGPADEIAIVRWIFGQFVKKGKRAVEIAIALNERGVVTDLNQPWSTSSVRTVLTNEKYIGNNVWNRKSTRLHSKRVGNPVSTWVRVENASEPLVSRDLFNRAQAIAKARACRISNEQMLVDLSKLLEKRGWLSASIINAAPDCSKKSLYIHRFGSLQVAYRLIGFEASLNYRYFDLNNQLHRRRLELIEDLVAAIGKAGGVAYYDAKTGLLRINEEFTVAIWVARYRPTSYGYPRWPFRRRRETVSDISVLIRMKTDNVTVRDYLIAPADDAQRAPPMLRSNSGTRLDAFLFQSLDPLVELAKRAPIELGS